MTPDDLSRVMRSRRTSMLVDRDRPVPDDPGELTRMVADLQLFAVHAQDAAARDGQEDEPVQCRGKDLSPTGMGFYMPHNVTTARVLAEQHAA